MSAIAGMFTRTGALVDRKNVDGMVAAMEHRAPADREFWGESSVGLGFGAPCDPQESLCEDLPFVNRSGTLAITGDLRIDNRQQLIRALDPDRPAGGDIGDAALVLAAYQRWGRESPSHLVGAFAFAIWDGRRRELFCVRDHLGAKPFEYHLSRVLFAFASETEAVLAAPGVPNRVNEGRIADFLVSELEGVDHTATFHLDVMRLPPAHFLVVGRDGQRLERYWRPDPGHELRLANEAEYVEAFLESLRQAVGACLRGGAPPALMLSGGIDSGAVAASAVELFSGSKSPALRTVSAIDDSARNCRESSCIRQSINTLGVDALTLGLSRIPEIGAEARRAVFECGDPFDSGLTVPALLYEEARRSGSRVVLDGVDGDVVMSVGRTHLVQLAKRGRFVRALKEASALNEVEGRKRTPVRQLTGDVARAFLPDRLLRMLRRLRGTPGRVEGAIDSSIIDPDFARRIDLAGRLAELDHLRWFAASGDARRDQAHSLIHPYIAAALERYDRVAARRGIDLRHPLLSLPLVEFCLALPWDSKVRNGWKKYIVRRATANALPEAVRWRQDGDNVMWTFTEKILEIESDHMRTTIERCATDLEPYVDMVAIRGALRPCDPDGHLKSSGVIFQAYILARWLGRRRV